MTDFTSASRAVASAGVSMVKRVAVHGDEALGCQPEQRGARGLDPERLAILAGGVAAAAHDVPGGAEFVGERGDDVEVVLHVVFREKVFVKLN
jgi:hypothetical protein